MWKNNDAQIHPQNIKKINIRKLEKEFMPPTNIQTVSAAEIRKLDLEI